MKAYYVFVRNDEDQGGGLVFAETVQEARSHYHRFDLDPDRWIDVAAHRNKGFNNLEHLTSLELSRVQWRDGWYFCDMNVPDPDEASDAVFDQWYSENVEMTA